MQLKTFTVVAATLALAQAKVNGTWADQTGGVKSPVLDTEAPSSTKPVEIPTGKPDRPVDGGKTSVADSTAEESSTTWSDVEFPSSTEAPVDGGKTSVADETASSTWVDVEIPSSTPVDGGKTSVADETTSSTVPYWGDASLPVDGGKTTTEETTTEQVTKTYTKPDGSEITTTEVNTKTITKTVYLTPTGGPAPPAETPVSGDEGKPPAGGPPAGGPAPPAETPVSGDEGKPPAGGPPAGGPPAAPGGGECGTVTTTVTNVVTVTVPAGGKPTGGQFFTKPADTTAPAVETSTFSATWQDQATGFQTSAAPAPSAPAQGGYMGVVSKWRSNMGMSPLEQDSKLQNNAQDASNSSGGQLKHKLNPGSMAQIMAPGNADNFESVFLGGWLCELPNTPGLGSSVCNAASKGWDYAGQTGHAEILTSTKYSKIGCALGNGIWCCDLA